ncbi:unnamed protein product [Lathyrus sativus]|nr:unnamed protein product [Lathyrus sativus]
MNSKIAIIHILGLLALAVLISSEVSARVFTETSSNTKMDGGYPGNPHVLGGIVGRAAVGGIVGRAAVDGTRN